MSRLIAGVREAEERLAGLARALQSAWDEELGEAQGAREAARRSLARALAMQEAAQALGRPELAARVDEVVRQLRQVEEEAVRRLEELNKAERSFQMRLEEGIDDAARALPPASEPRPEPVVEVAAEETPAGPPFVEVPHAEEVESPPGDASEEPEVEIAVELEPKAVDAPKPSEPEPVIVASLPVREDLGPSAALLGVQKRVDELERLVTKLPLEVFDPALEELVAQVRLLARDRESADEGGAGLLLERLRALAASRGRETTFGLSEDEFADWTSLAADARARRQRAVALLKARQKRA